MNIKTAIALVKDYFAHTVTVLLILSGGMMYVWGEYKDLLNERKSLDDEIVRSERNRADASLALIAQKAELDKRQFILEQLEGRNKEKLAAIQQRAIEYDVAFGKLQKAQSNVSEAQRQKEIEDKLQDLMSQFSAMGVSLNDQFRCGDVDSQTRYNAAKAKYSEIYTLAEAHGLKKRYGDFFFRNGQSIFPACVK